MAFTFGIAETLQLRIITFQTTEMEYILSLSEMDESQTMSAKIISGMDCILCFLIAANTEKTQSRITVRVLL